jgi:hypothetical protein
MYKKIQLIDQREQRLEDLKRKRDEEKLLEKLVDEENEKFIPL